MNRAELVRRAEKDIMRADYAMKIAVTALKDVRKNLLRVSRNDSVAVKGRAEASRGAHNIKKFIRAITTIGA